MGARPSGQVVQAAVVLEELLGLLCQLVPQVCRRTIQREFVFQVDLQSPLVPSEILHCRFALEPVIEIERHQPRSGTAVQVSGLSRRGSMNVTGANDGDASGSPRITAA